MIFDIVNARGLEIPNIPKRLKYSRLSEMIHRPHLTKIFVMSDKDEKFKNFMFAIGA